MAKHDDEPGFSFAKLAGADNYKTWARESAGLWDHTLSDAENPKPLPIILKGDDLNDDAKVDRQENRFDKIIAWSKNNLKCKGYIGRMCLGHIQQEFQAIKTALKIRMLNNLGPAFKTYLTVVNDRMRTDEKLEDDEVLFKAIEEEETRMKAEQKASASFAFTKSKSSQGNPSKQMKAFVEWPKCKKCGCKHLAEKVCRHINDECDKCHKKGHISQFHDSYTSLNKPANSSSGTSSSTSTSQDSSKTRSVTCVTRATANKITNPSSIQKLIADSSTTQHLIVNRDLMGNYYEDYSEYQTGSGEVLPSYSKGTLHLPLDNGSLTLLDVWYAPDLGYNLTSTSRVPSLQQILSKLLTNSPPMPKKKTSPPAMESLDPKYHQ